MSRVAQDEGDVVAVGGTQLTTAEFEDQGEAFSRAIDREFRQVLALVELAEREQELEMTMRFQRSALLLLVVVIAGVCNCVFVIVNDPLVGFVVGFVVGLFTLAAVYRTRSRLDARISRHEKTAAALGETIREVILASNWKSKLDPLDWAQLRTRVANLELIDLSSLK